MSLPLEPSYRPSADDVLPPVLAGPIVRRATADSLALWLVTSAASALHLRVVADGSSVKRRLREDEARCIPLGEHAFVYLIQVQFMPCPNSSASNGLRSDGLSSLRDVRGRELIQRKLALVAGFSRGKRAVLEGRADPHAQAEERIRKWLK